ncbi:MAG: carbohydrate kinase, partial [Alphaproteobacteria bacterium]|nr:carbohydrate kinase [Alphaproteobacteria bacterium]
SCNATQKLREKTWGASFGDAFLAALAVGDAKPGDMAKWNPVTREIKPDRANRVLYDEVYRRFRALYEAGKAAR